jgi:hypothetical protein
MPGRYLNGDVPAEVDSGTGAVIVPIPFAGAVPIRVYAVGGNPNNIYEWDNQGRQRGPGGAGFASRCKKEGNCERAQSGTITFDRYEEGSGASGHYELHFKGDETLSGTFDVKWCQERVICG